MANVFQNPTFLEEVASDAAILLSSNLTAANLIPRQIEGRLQTSKTGGSVNVRVFGADTANTQDHSSGTAALSTTDATETTVAVDARHYVYIRKKIDTLEKTHQVADITRELTMPAMIGIAEAVDQYLIRRIAGGFAPNLTGTAGTAPSTLAHVGTARKKLNDNKAATSPRVGIIGTAAENSFLQLDAFTNADYGQNRPMALREATLGRLFGIDWYMSQNAGTFNQGDVAGTVLANGAGTAADTTVALDGFTASTGTVREGTRFTVAGDSTTYTVTADTAIASNAVAAMPVTPAVVTGWADNAAVTFETAFTSDVIFNPQGVAGAIVAPSPLAMASSVGSFDGLSVRVSFESTITDASSGAADYILYDVYVGGRVLKAANGVVMQG